MGFASSNRTSGQELLSRTGIKKTASPWRSRIFSELLPLQRAHEEKSQRSHLSHHRANCQLALFQQVSLIAAKLAWA